MKYLDFDRMMAEREPEPVRVRAFGETVAVPGAIPAVLVLELMRYDEGEPIPAPALIRAAARLFGEAAVERWMNERNASLDALAELVRRTLALLSGESTEPEPLSEDGAQLTPKN